MINRLGLDTSAIVAGLISFVAIYAIGGMLIIFVMSLFSERFSADALQTILRVGGYIALAIPTYVATRAASVNAIRHGLIVGLIESLAILMLMTLTFSWEGTLQHQVLLRMLPVFLALNALCCIGTALAEWQNRRDARPGE
ncbi:MAG: hypothetical protein EP315_04845 [Gammaproteobacteria bacterium]|nr:MAG: hypothetical protein EP315_04845 [Gammaproteobacteria bacterium]